MPAPYSIFLIASLFGTVAFGKNPVYTRTFPKQNVTSSTVSAANPQLIALGFFNGDVYVLNRNTGAVEFEIHRDAESQKYIIQYVQTLSFSPNGKVLAVSYSNNKTHFWNLETKKMLFSVHDSGLFSNHAIQFLTDVLQEEDHSGTHYSVSYFVTQENSALYHPRQVLINIPFERAGIVQSETLLGPKQKALVYRFDEKWDVEFDLAHSAYKKANGETKISLAVSGYQKDHGAYIYDVKSGSMTGKKGDYQIVASSPAGADLTLLAVLTHLPGDNSSRAAKSLKILNPLTNEITATMLVGKIDLGQSDNREFNATFSPNGKLLAVSNQSVEGVTVSGVFDVKTGKRVCRFEPSVGSRKMERLSFSADGSKILAMNAQYDGFVFNSADCKERWYREARRAGFGTQEDYPDSARPMQPYYQFAGNDAVVNVSQALNPNVEFGKDNHYRSVTVKVWTLQ